MTTMLKFHGCMEYGDMMMARLETEENQIPLNVILENYEEYEDLPDGTECEILLIGDWMETTVYDSREDYFQDNNFMDATALIPSGTFPAYENGVAGEYSGQTPMILYSGTVLEAEYREQPDEKKPNYRLLVETLDLKFQLFTRYEGMIRDGSIVHGTAFMSGIIEDVEE